MANKVTIVGAGSVGSTIAFMMAVKGIASEIVIIDINEKKALGEAMDIRQGTPFCAPCKIYAGRYEDAAGSDIVVITSGIGRNTRCLVIGIETCGRVEMNPNPDVVIAPNSRLWVIGESDDLAVLLEDNLTTAGHSPASAAG